MNVYAFIKNSSAMCICTVCVHVGCCAVLSAVWGVCSTSNTRINMYKLSLSYHFKCCLNFLTFLHSYLRVAMYKCYGCVSDFCVFFYTFGIFIHRAFWVKNWLRYDEYLKLKSVINLVNAHGAPNMLFIPPKSSLDPFLGLVEYAQQIWCPYIQPFLSSGQN